MRRTPARLTLGGRWRIAGSRTRRTGPRLVSLASVFVERVNEPQAPQRLLHLLFTLRFLWFSRMLRRFRRSTPSIETSD